MDVCMHDFARLRLSLALLIIVELLPGEILWCAPAITFCLLAVRVLLACVAVLLQHVCYLCCHHCCIRASCHHRSH
jgi:hypothetical protein